MLALLQTTKRRMVWELAALGDALVEVGSSCACSAGSCRYSCFFLSRLESQITPDEQELL